MVESLSGLAQSVFSSALTMQINFPYVHYSIKTQLLWIRKLLLTVVALSVFCLFFDYNSNADDSSNRLHHKRTEPMMSSICSFS
jgi:hypothetical protein